MSVEFGTSDISAMIAEMENEDAAGKFVSKYWSPKKEGVTKIRFLPQLKSFGEKLFYQKHMIHYINGRPYMCLSQTLTDKDGNLHEAETCPFCKKSKQLYSTSERDTPEWKLAGELRAKERFVSRIIVRGKQDNDGNDIEFKPEFYEFGSKIRDMIKAALTSGEYGQPFDLKAGRDFNLSKKGQKKNTDYSGSMFSGNQSPIFSESAKLKALLEELPKMNYNQLVEFESSESLEKVLREYLSDEPEEELPKMVETRDEVEDAIFGVKKEETSSGEEEDDLDALLNSI